MSADVMEGDSLKPSSGTISFYNQRLWHVENSNRSWKGIWCGSAARHHDRNVKQCCWLIFNRVFCFSEDFDAVKQSRFPSARLNLHGSPQFHLYRNLFLNSFQECHECSAGAHFSYCRSECCIGGESMAASRVKRSLAPTH